MLHMTGTDFFREAKRPLIRLKGRFTEFLYSLREEAKTAPSPESLVTKDPCTGGHRQDISRLHVQHEDGPIQLKTLRPSQKPEARLPYSTQGARSATRAQQCQRIPAVAGEPFSVDRRCRGLPGQAAAGLRLRMV